MNKPHPVAGLAAEQDGQVGPRRTRTWQEHSEHTAPPARSLGCLVILADGLRTGVRDRHVVPVVGPRAAVGILADGPRVAVRVPAQFLAADVISSNIKVQQC
jgi:hypothetical protein